MLGRMVSREHATLLDRMNVVFLETKSMGIHGLLNDRRVIDNNSAQGSLGDRGLYSVGNQMGARMRLMLLALIIPTVLRVRLQSIQPLLSVFDM